MTFGAFISAKRKELTGRLKRFDESACMLLLKDGSNIPISHIIGLESAYFEGLF